MSLSNRSGQALRPGSGQATVGTSALRLEGPQKLTGGAKYIDDYELPGCLHGVTVRSTVPHARIKNIVFDPKFPWNECVVATARDVPVNEIALLDNSQPLLADALVRHPAEPIALIAHPDRQKAYDALRFVKVEYEELPPVLDYETSKTSFKDYLISKGNLAKGFAQADFVVEGEYRVPAQEHAYIENNGMAAWW